MAGLLGQNQEKKKESSQNGLLDMDALQETRDKKLSPVEQLADTEFRVQLNPQGIAQYSDAYRNPSKYTGVALYNEPSNVQGFYINTGAVTSESIFEDPEEAKKVAPDQVFWPGRSYQVSTELGQSTVPHHWAKESPEDVLHHEAAHDAIELAAKSEFMSGPYKELYAELDSNAANVLGVQISEALTRHHDTIYPKSDYARVSSRRWFTQELMRARDNSREYPSWHESLGRRSMKPWEYYQYNTSEVRRLWQQYEDLLQSQVLDPYGKNKLAEMYDAIEAAAKKRHEALGYK